MITKKIGNTLKLVYTITNNDTPVAERDFAIFVYETRHPDEVVKLPVTIEDDKVVAVFEGMLLNRTGIYVSTIYENFRKSNLTVADQIAFSLTDDINKEVSPLELETVELVA